MFFTLFCSTMICSFIGWITNFLAIKMLFHPRKPLTIATLTIQGIFPKRQKALAMNLSAVIEEELLSQKDIQHILERPEFSAQLRERIRKSFHEFLDTRLGSLHPMLGMFLDTAMMEKILDLFEQELDRIVPSLIQTATQELDTHLDVRSIIQEKIEKLSMERLEALLMSIMAKEFRFIEIIGAVLGAVIGFFQALFFLNL